jgi:pimeloyl-ACP methyl ester carboxylesterase
MSGGSRTIASEASSAVLLPGVLCDGAVWGGQLAALGERVRCLVPEYGELDSLPAMAQAVLAQAPSRFVLVAHSMGGRVALEILRAAAARVRAVALLDTGYQARAAGPDGEREVRARQALLDLAANAGMAAMGRVWVRDMVPPARLADAALIEPILAMVARCTPQKFAAQIRALLARPDATGVLTQIRCPTLLLCGREDTWSPPARHEAMACLIPHARLAVIEDCGHMSPMERPDEVAAQLSQWLAEALPGR